MRFWEKLGFTCVPQQYCYFSPNLKFSDFFKTLYFGRKKASVSNITILSTFCIKFIVHWWWKIFKLKIIVLLESCNWQFLKKARGWRIDNFPPPDHKYGKQKITEKAKNTESNKLDGVRWQMRIYWKTKQHIHGGINQKLLRDVTKAVPSESS